MMSHGDHLHRVDHPEPAATARAALTDVPAATAHSLAQPHLQPVAV